MSGVKYIVVLDEEKGRELMFTFPCSIYHDDFAEIITDVKHRDGRNDWERRYLKPVSAGFVNSGKCSGRSEMLNLESRPEIDTVIFNSGFQRIVKINDAASPSILDLLRKDHQLRGLKK